MKAADSYDPTKNRYAILSVNGDGGRNVNVTINGVDNKDNTVGGPGHAASRRSRAGIPDFHAAFFGGKRPLFRRRDQRDHQVGYPTISTARLSDSSANRLSTQTRSCQRRRNYFSSQSSVFAAVLRRLCRRTDQERQILRHSSPMNASANILDCRIAAAFQSCLCL